MQPFETTEGQPEEGPVGGIINCAGYADGRRIADLAITDARDFMAADPARFVWIGLYEPDEDLLRQVQLEFGLVRIQEALDNFRELLSSALDANLSLLWVAQNDDVKRLAAWAAILAVPTMVAGVYGMNFRFMPELQWSWGYPVILGGMATACLSLWIGFRRSGWL